MLKSLCSEKNLGCSVTKALLILWLFKAFASSLEIHVLHLSCWVSLYLNLYISTHNFHFHWKVCKMSNKHRCVVFHVVLYICTAFCYLKVLWALARIPEEAYILSSINCPRKTDGSTKDANPKAHWQHLEQNWLLRHLHE